ncbi:hypothetical protein F5888DRAFT_1632014 [Russula emetica]|nr:hypothetical protein F5888DRAFT_1632014 [Russula emetica]
MADVANDGTGVSQSQTRKRFDPRVQWSTTNAADRKRAPPSPGDSEYTEHWFAQSQPASPETSTASNYALSTASNDVPSSPGSPSGSHGGASPEYGTPHSYDPSWDSDRFTLSEQWLVDDDPNNPPSPESVARPPTPPSSSPTPSVGSTDGRPPPSPGSDVNPPPSSEIQRPAEHESESFLEKLLKGKIRRHISGPVAVDPTTYLGILPKIRILLRPPQLVASLAMVQACPYADFHITVKAEGKSDGPGCRMVLLIWGIRISDCRVTVVRRVLESPAWIRVLPGPLRGGTLLTKLVFAT